MVRSEARPFIPHGGRSVFDVPCSVTRVGMMRCKLPVRDVTSSVRSLPAPADLPASRWTDESVRTNILRSAEPYAPTLRLLFSRRRYPRISVTGWAMTVSRISEEAAFFRRSLVYFPTPPIYVDVQLELSQCLSCGAEHQNLLYGKFRMKILHSCLVRATCNRVFTPCSLPSP
jgi:hypothetical protein